MASKRLQFDQPLTWKAGRQIPLTELLKRLSTLGTEIQIAKQEEFDATSLDKTAKELVSPQLLAHKDRGVKAWTAHCLVDVLKLYAPDAPYTPTELKEIFSLLLNAVIPALGDPSHPYHSQHLYVIQSLAEVQSIVLLSDVPGANTLVLRLFTECFDILSSSNVDVSKQVEYNLTLMLECMVEQCEAFPSEAVDVILAQFFHADPHARTAFSKSKRGDAAAKDEDGQAKIQWQLPPSYNVAKNLCTTCVGQMARYVSQYFSTVIVDASNLNTGGVDDGNNTVSEEDMKQLEKAHSLLRELWRSCPGVLQNVVPQIEAELSAENVQVRLLATAAVGDMIAGIGAGGNASPPPLNPSAYPQTLDSPSIEAPQRLSLPQSFPQSQPATFTTFLGRRNDKSSLIRARWAISIGRILATSAGGVGLESQTEKDLISYLSQTTADSDERVRIAAIQATGLLTVPQIVKKLGFQGGMDADTSFLRNIADRVRDRKASVRHEAIHFLAKTWAAALPAISAEDITVQELLGSSPSKVFNAYYLNDKETNCFIDQILFEYLLPVGYPAVKKDRHTSNNTADATGSTDGPIDPDAIRTERMLLLIDSLDSKAKPVFFSLVSRPRKLAPYMEAFLKRCEDFNGGVMENNESEIRQHLNRLIDHLSKNLADPVRATEDLKKFAKVHDRRSYALIRFCMAAESDYRKVQKSLKELERKIAGYAPQNSSMYETIRSIVLKVSNLFSNKSHIRSIINFTQTNDRGLEHAAHELSKHISTETPAVFKSHTVELCHSLEASAPGNADSIEANPLDTLKACASFARKFPKDVPKERKFLQAMTQYALRGEPPTAAKHAVSIILHATDKRRMYVKNLTKSCIEDFQFGSPNFLSKLACLSQLMLLAADELEDEADDVLDIAISKVLKDVRSPSQNSDSVEWSDQPDEELQAKIWAIRILVNRVRHYENPEAIREVYPQVYKMLNLLCKTKGELSKDANTPRDHRSRLHLQAALSLLKLSAKRGFDALLDPTGFNELVLTAQDHVPEVRKPFVSKIMELLGSDRLAARFHVPIFSMAFEPTPRLREDAATWLRARAAQQRQRIGDYRNVDTQAPLQSRPVLELTLARFLAYLAHHPDFTTEHNDILDTGKYITFYLSCIATEQNLPLIYHIAQRVKSVQDGLVETWEGDVSSSENLYILSDLAQAIIREWQEQKGWSLQIFGGKVHVPAQIFRSMPSVAIAQEVAKKNYVPEDIREQIESLVKEALGRGGKKRKSEGEGDDVERARKRAAATSKIARHPPSAPKANANTKKRPRTPDAEGSEDVSDEDEWANAKKKRKSVNDEIPSSERRKSSRARGRKSYADTREEDDEKDMWDWQGDVKDNEWQYIDGEKSKRIKSTMKSPGKSFTREDRSSPTVDQGGEDAPSEENEDNVTSLPIINGTSKANASPAKSQNDDELSPPPPSDNEDNVSGSSKENAGVAKAPASRMKQAASGAANKKKVTKTKPEPRAGTRTSARRAKA